MLKKQFNFFLFQKKDNVEEDIYQTTFIDTPFKKRVEILDLENECLTKMRHRGIDDQEKATSFLNNINKADHNRSLKQFDKRTPDNVAEFLKFVITFL